MLTGVCIIVAELCLLFRLALPHILDFAEQRFAEVYSGRPEPTGDHTYSEWFAVPTLGDGPTDFHTSPTSRKGQR